MSTKQSKSPFGLGVKLSAENQKVYSAWLQKQAETIYRESMDLGSRPLFAEDQSDMEDCLRDPTDSEYSEDDLRAAFLAGMMWACGVPPTGSLPHLPKLPKPSASKSKRRK